MVYVSVLLEYKYGTPESYGSIKGVGKPVPVVDTSHLMLITAENYKIGMGFNRNGTLEYTQNLSLQSSLTVNS